MRDKKESRRYLTTTQAARRAHVSSSTLLRAVQSKKLKAFSTPGGHFRIDPASLDAFLAASGFRAEKAGVLLLSLHPAEREKFLARLEGEEGLSVLKGKKLPGEKPCVVLLDASGASKGRKITGDALIAQFRRWCGASA